MKRLSAEDENQCFRASIMALRKGVTSPDVLPALIYYPYTTQKPAPKHFLQVTLATAPQQPSLSSTHKFSLGVSLLCLEASHGRTHACVGFVTRSQYLAGEEWQTAGWTGRTDFSIQWSQKRRQANVYLCNCCATNNLDCFFFFLFDKSVISHIFIITYLYSHDQFSQ